MAFTQTDIEKLETAIKSGLLEVEYQGGYRVRYQSLADMIKLRSEMKTEVAGPTSPPRFSDTIYDRG